MYSRAMCTNRIRTAHQWKNKGQDASRWRTIEDETASVIFNLELNDRFILDFSFPDTPVLAGSTLP